MSTAIHVLISTGRDSVDQNMLFDFLITRAQIFTKMSMQTEALDDLDKAIKISAAFKDDYLQRSLRSIALLQASEWLVKAPA
jgi:hypothetical protein